MKVVIPAKTSSTRVRDKNFRPFHGDRSLFDVKLGQLLRTFAPHDVYVSSEDLAVRRRTDAWQVNFLPREPALARNETPFAAVVAAVCADVPGDDDIVWCHVTDPLFDQYDECVDAWRQAGAGYDSLVVVYPFRAYLLDADHRPMGFGFGPWHTPSQALPVRYQLAFTCSILTRAAAALGPVGARPLWFHAGNRMVDIDDEEDFVMASSLFATRTDGWSPASAPPQRQESR